MAVVWVEGFEAHRTLTQFARKYASITGGFTTTGTGRVHGFSGSPQTTVGLTPAFTLDNTAVIGFALNLASHTAALNTGAKGLYFETGTFEQCHIELESTSVTGVRVLLKRGATTVATSSYMNFATWYYVELLLTVRDGTDGAYEIRINGVPDVSGTGVDLANNATDGWDVFAFRYNANVGNLVYDDMYVCNGTGGVNDTFLGPQIVEAITVTGNGATNAWTPSSGSNFDNVDDPGTSSPDDAGAGGYNGSDTNGQVELYAHSDLSFITGDVTAVMVTAQCAMAAAGSRVVKHKYRDLTGPTLADGASFTVASTTYAGFNHVYDVNPATAAAWDIADVDDGQFGLEVVS